MNIALLRIGLAVPIAACILLGCTTSPTNTSSGQTNARRDLAQAWSMYEEGEYYQVVFELQQLVNKAPRTPAAIEARYLLGLTYTKLESHLDAIDMFKSYLQQAPDGEYADDARERTQALAKRYDDMFPSAQKIAQDIADVQQALQADPESLQLNTKLADLFWKQGNYEASGEIYNALVVKHPNYRTDPALNTRMEFGSGNSYVVLTPDEIRRRDVERNPLSIFNTTSFRTGRDRFTRTFKNYVVTGQVINRSDKSLQGVEVHSTVHGFGNTVFDTGVFRIGNMRPGDVRSFSLRFSNFEDLNNIDSYECFTTYQE